MMEYQEILVRQYVAYLESKDRFVERSFKVNRFYFVLMLINMVLLCVALELQGERIYLSTIAFSVTGMVVSLLWLLNQDSYLYLIKVKLADVLEKFEAHLPFQPHILEYEGIKERGKKMKVVFPEVQKAFAFVSFLAYFVVFLLNAGVKVVLLFNSLF